jgi:inner membrane protein
MDLITHVVLPYLLGSSLRMDKRLLVAFIIGAVAPDLDVFIVWLSMIFPYPNLLLVHRGIVHSLIFGFLMALAAMFLLSRHPLRDTFRRWTGVDFILSWPVAVMALAGVVMHIFLDYLITKGVPLLYPLSTERFSAELLFHYEIFILVSSVIIALWLIRVFFNRKSISQKAIGKLLVLFLIVILAVVGARVEGKERALAFESYGQIERVRSGYIEVFPDWSLFQWIILDRNESTFQVYSYNALSNNISYIASYPKLHIEPGSSYPESDSGLNITDSSQENADLGALYGENEVSSLRKALIIADSNPKVFLFRWRAGAVAINASNDNGSWSLEYYDPVSKAGMAKDPIWMKEMLKRSVSLKVLVEEDQAHLIG